VVFYAFIILGPVLCLTTTINGVIAGFTVVLEKATQDGWFAKGFAAKNRWGAPWIILTTIAATCILPVVFSVNIGLLTSNTVFLGSCLQIPLLIAFWWLPDKFPDEFAKSTLKVSVGMYRCIMVFAVAARLVIFYFSLRNLNVYNAVGSVIAIGGCFLYSYLRYRTGKPKVVESYFFD
jgi:hypothetical protein